MNIKKTKIVATIGPVSSNKETMSKLIDAGVNTIRLNMSHGDYEEQMERVNFVREINKEKGTNVSVLLDTKGPEVRTGLFKEKKVLLEKGKTVIITMDEVEGTSERFTVSYKGLAEDLNPGDTILLDDGYVSVKVLEINGNDINCEIMNTGYMKDRRGVNVPGVTLNFEFMSEKDKNDIIWACENNFDYIAASFIRNATDMKEILDVVATTGNKHIQIIPKIESQDGVEHFDEILALADGVMVARGDLGVEVPAEEVPVVQKMIIKKCNLAGKFVITATQMLESMQSNPRPTRAEVSDVFNAVIDGTDAVMLSGESAAGDYPVESVATQATIAKRAEEIYDYSAYNRTVYKNLDNSIEQLVAFSVVSTAEKLDNAKLIIAVTNSGATARTISQMKPKTPILAITHDEEVLRSLALNYGVLTAYMGKIESVDEILDAVCEKAKELDIVVPGDVVIISAGSIHGKGNTDLMKVRVVK
jgi:pyruvate kinase